MRKWRVFPKPVTYVDFYRLYAILQGVSVHFVPLHVCMHVDACACLCMCKHVATCARCLYVHLYVCVYTYVLCTYTHVYIPTHVCLMYESMSVQMQGKLLAVCVREYLAMRMCLCNELPFAFPKV